MELAKSHIIIVAERTPRSKYFESLIKEEYHDTTCVEIASYDKLFDLDMSSENVLFVIDLMDFERSAFNIIEKLKTKYSSAKILALHIYQSQELVTPLFKKGVDGYVSSDPTRKEFFRAMGHVLNGKTYKPDFTE
jgi:DNA-binding NarL/FixJ family response regulator